MNELNKLALKYGADKCPQIRHFYTDYYYELLRDKRETIKKVLEIGVGSPEIMTHCPNYVRGASLYMWRDFFPNAKIYGADILPELIFEDGRVETFFCDQSNSKTLRDLIKLTGTDIDLFIDDGSHRPSHQTNTCKTLLPLLKKDVIYIIEDVGTGSVANSLGKCDYEFVKHPNEKYISRWDRLLVIRKKHE